MSLNDIEGGKALKEFSASSHFFRAISTSSDEVSSSPSHLRSSSSLELYFSADFRIS